MPHLGGESHMDRQQDHEQHVPYPRGQDPGFVRRKFILCFDGTGNKFSGTDSDSNILKLYRMLDRSDGTQFHYYQPGIGTYVASQTLAHKSLAGRVRSWYMKSKDSAVGSSFGDHVMSGYRVNPAISFSFLQNQFRDADEKMLVSDAILHSRR
jgi:uncharacterized protein (DUF2235 family)